MQVSYPAPIDATLLLSLSPFAFSGLTETCQRLSDAVDELLARFVATTGGSKSPGKGTDRLTICRQWLKTRHGLYGPASGAAENGPRATINDRSQAPNLVCKLNFNPSFLRGARGGITGSGSAFRPRPLARAICERAAE